MTTITTTTDLLTDEMVKLTEHEELSRETVRRRLAENDLKPWRKDMWCIPQVDAEYVARMEDVLDLSFADYRFRRSLALMFGVAGVVLSLLGLYSLMTRRVAQRRRELGIRAALGASPRGLATVVFREALMVGVGGAIFGLVISAWVGQMIGALLVTVSPVEPTIFVFAALGVNLAAIGAVIAPAVAAFRTDTVAVLRE